MLFHYSSRPSSPWCRPKATKLSGKDQRVSISGSAGHSSRSQLLSCAAGGAEAAAAPSDPRRWPCSRDTVCAWRGPAQDSQQEEAADVPPTTLLKHPALPPGRPPQAPSRAVRLPGFSAGGIESIARSALSRVFPSARASRGQSKSLHVSTVHSFLLLNHIPLSGWIQHNSFIHSPVCSHSGGFLFSVATNKVALSTCHCIGHMLSFLLVKNPGVRWLGHIVRTYLIFQESYY